MTKEETKIPDTDSGKLWTKIKDMKIGVFGLENQFVSKYFEPIFVDDKSLHLKYNVPAAIPSLETILTSAYKVEQAQMGGMKLLVVSLDQAAVQTNNTHVMIGLK